MASRIFRFLLAVTISSMLLPGCFLFKKKNKCGDCPKWNKAPVEQTDTRQC